MGDNHGRGRRGRGLQESCAIDLPLYNRGGDALVAAARIMNFFEIIQTYFIELTGRMITFGGRDVELLATWRAQGATAAMICRGLRDATAAFSSGDPPRNLHACRAFVEPHVDRARSLFTTASPVPLRTGEPCSGAARLREARARIEEAGARCTGERLRGAYRLAWRRLHALEQQAIKGTLLDVEEALAVLEVELIRDLWEALRAEERHEIEERLRAESAALLPRMSAEARRHHLAARRRKALRERYALPSLLAA